MIIHGIATFFAKFKKRPNARRNAWISSKALVPKSCIIGERVKIKDKVVLGENCFINDDVYVGGEITIGKCCRIECKTMINSCTTYGNGCMRNPPLFPINKCVAGEEDIPVKIGNYVAIGTLCFISKGVTIGDKAVIMSGSIVYDDVPEYAIVRGNPAKIIGYRNSKSEEKVSKK